MSSSGRPSGSPPHCEPDLANIESHLDIAYSFITGVKQSLQQGWESLRLETQRARQAIEKERADLEASRESLQHEWANFERCCARAKEMVNRNDFIKLNVGGTIFETTTETILAEKDSMFCAMFSGHFQVERSEDGACRIDRDSHYFHDILSYLRFYLETVKGKGKATVEDVTRWLHLKEYSGQTKAFIKAEAEFYSLDTLVKSMKELKTLVVGPTGKYQRISEALQFAVDGDTILVQPGIYHDSFIMHRCVDIVGQGGGEPVIIRSPCGNVVESRAKTGSIRGLVLEGTGTTNPSGNSNSITSLFGDHYCLLITSGCIVVEECEIRYAGLSCVKIVGDSEEAVDPIIRHNVIHHANQCGVLLANVSRGRVENNEIYENRFSGIEIRNGSNPEIRHNHIHDNRQNGVYIHSEGTGVLDSNMISHNSFNGINVEGAVVVSNNTVHNNAKRGVFHGPETKMDNNLVNNNVLGDVAQKM